MSAIFKRANQLSPVDWSTFLVWFLDLLALGALAGTFEVRKESFFAAFALFAISRISFLSAGTKLRLVGFAAAILGALYAWIFHKAHPIVAAAHAVPICHAILWFAGNSSTMRGWRLTLGFVELILASALTTELYLFLAIFTFVVLGSIVLSCNFLEKNQVKSVPQDFLLATAGQALLIFLSSIIIFPILPRMRSDYIMGKLNASVGYTESVELNESMKLSGFAKGSVVMQLFTDDARDLLNDIYLGLIRGKILDHFNGTQWNPIAKPIQFSLASKPGSVQMEVIRDSMSSEILPVPYGATNVRMKTEEGLRPVGRMASGEFIEPFSRRGRVRYLIDLYPNRLKKNSEAIHTDPPKKINRDVPKALDNPRMHKLAQRVFAKAKTNHEKILSVIQFYSEEKFSASTDTADSGSSRSTPDSGLHPIENFLFIRKQGHCEWFASSAAVLLRLAGVPTRLVAGFRITQQTSASVLIIRSGDAHAWLEAWSEKKGWIPLDPTPRLIAERGVFDFIRENYELLSAYWTRYILAFNTNGESASQEHVATGQAGLNASLSKAESRLKRIFNENRELVIGVIVLIVLTPIIVLLILRKWFPWVLSIRWRVRSGPRHLSVQRYAVELTLRKALDQREIELEKSLHELRERNLHAGADILEQWLSTYYQARFGKRTKDLRECVAALKAHHRELKRNIA